jgi:uncharacterized protein YbgA (DUF1722 family)
MPNDELVLKVKDSDGMLLRTKGYYLDSLYAQDEKVFYDVCVFYKNGVVRYLVATDSISYLESKSFVNFSNSHSNPAYSWGIYTLKDSSIDG